MKYIYGPVNSRRLGFSLGVSLSLHKVCNFDCLYCQLGRTKIKTGERKEYAKIEDILPELKFWLQTNPEELKNLNYITLSGSGEPTLNNQINRLISEIKKLTSVPVAVITNSSLLIEASVRGEILAADLIVPSLDAVAQDIFVKIDRPSEDVKIEEIIAGLVNLRKEFKGQLWLEVMLVAGVNDDLRQIKKLKEIVEKINPDKIQINSPVRSTAEDDIFPVDKSKLEKIKGILGERCEII